MNGFKYLVILCCIFYVSASEKKINELEKFTPLTENLYTGSAPDKEAMKALKEAGFKSIISVDAARPLLDEASKSGLKYAHIPVPYKGIDEANALKLIVAYSRLPKPVFLHCHHGVHRAPASAMIILKFIDKWQTDKAVKKMQEIGTAAHYKGLYRDVKKDYDFSQEVIKNHKKIPSYNRISDFDEQMAHADRIYDRLKKAAKTNWQKSKTDELGPAHDALLLMEAFREMQRNDKGKEYVEGLKSVEEMSSDLKTAIETGKVEFAKKRFAAIKNSCKDCHDRSRNN